MNTNMAGFGCFSKMLCSCVLDESSLSIGRVKKHSISLNIFHISERADPIAKEINV